MLGELLGIHGNAPKDRALAMLLMAAAGLHTFDLKAGRQPYEALDKVGMDDEAKRRFIANRHEKRQIGEILLQRCGRERCWYDSWTRPALGTKSGDDVHRLETHPVPAPVSPLNPNPPKGSGHPEEARDERSRIEAAWP